MRRWRLPDGRVLAEAVDSGDTQFYVLDADGRVAKSFARRVFSYEDDLYTHLFVVRDAQFLRDWSIERGDEIRTGADVEFDELRALGEGESPTAAEVDAALVARHDRGQSKAVAERTRIDDLAKPPANALSDMADPRRRLATRVVRYNDQLAASMLAFLDALAGLRGRAERVAGNELHAATQLVGEACAFVTFDPTARSDGAPSLQVDFGGTPQMPESPVLEALIEPRRLLDQRLQRGDDPVVREALGIVDSLEGLARELVFAADTQAYVDARQNATCYLRAAGLLVAAADRMAKACAHLLTT